MIVRLLLAACLVLLVWSAPRPAQAAASCSGTTVSNAAFGSPDMLGGPAVNTTATISISCTGMTAGTFYYCLSIGPGGGGTSGSYRLMAAGSPTVQYNFYQDSARTIPWGSRTNSSLGTVPGISITGTATVTGTYTIYAGIPSGQTTVSPGSYSSAFSGSTNTNFFVLASGQTNCMTGTIKASPPAVNPSFSATVSPTANCTIGTNPLAFGAQGLLTSAINATTTISVTCTNTTPYNVGLDPGATLGATVTTRQMSAGAARVSYALYRNAAHSQNWGQTIGTDTVAGTGTGLAQTLTVYGQVPIQTTPNPGAYSDSVVATVTY